MMGDIRFLPRNTHQTCSCRHVKFRWVGKHARSFGLVRPWGWLAVDLHYKGQGLVGGAGETERKGKTRTEAKPCTGMQREAHTERAPKIAPQKNNSTQHTEAGRKGKGWRRDPPAGPSPRRPPAAPRPRRRAPRMQPSSGRCTHTCPARRGGRAGEGARGGGAAGRDWGLSGCARRGAATLKVAPGARGGVKSPRRPFETCGHTIPSPRRKKTKNKKTRERACEETTRARTRERPPWSRAGCAQGVGGSCGAGWWGGMVVGGLRKKKKSVLLPFPRCIHRRSPAPSPPSTNPETTGLGCAQGALDIYGSLFGAAW